MSVCLPINIRTIKQKKIKVRAENFVGLEGLRRQSQLTPCSHGDLQAYRR